MCGFVGQINLNQTEINTQGLSTAAKHIDKRGPDSQMQWQSKGAAFAFNRLAIIDLDPRSNQPFLDASGRYVIMFNGEIYNHGEIRPLLEAKGYRFATNSDTEVVLYSILEWGELAFDKFNGMFAIALWDSVDRKLLLARDRIGVKPLYVDVGVVGSLRFASTLGCLTFLERASHELDGEALGFYFQNLYVPAPRSALKNVIKLSSGSIANYSADGHFEHHTWWTPHMAATQGKCYQNEQEALERLNSILRQAVKYRLVSDVPVGAFLSGGVDSSLIVSHMQALTSGGAKTFTIGFEESTHDESHVARAIAEHLGTDHTELILTSKDLLGQIEELSITYDEPFADVSAIPTLLVSQLARTQVTVALSGDGGDELFGGYPYYRHSMQYQLLHKLPELMRNSLSNLGQYIPQPSLSMGLRALKSHDTASLLAFMRSASKSVDWDELLLIAPLDTASLFRAVSQWRVGSNPAMKAMAIDLATYLPDDILTKVDRASMAHSLEARNPFLDKHMLEFALAQSESLLWDTKVSKHLLRKSLAQYLPANIVNLPKRGFAVPIRSWFRDTLREFVGDFASSSALQGDPILNGLAVDKIVGQHLSGSHNHENLIWAIIQYQRWKETYKIS